jgi:hypothetical protein
MRGSSADALDIDQASARGTEWLHANLERFTVDGRQGLEVTSLTGLPNCLAMSAYGR